MECIRYTDSDNGLAPVQYQALPGTNFISMSVILKSRCENVVYTIAAILGRSQCVVQDFRIELTLSPSDAKWRHRSRSTLAHVVVCCLTAPSHYLNQCWLIISEILRHSPENNFTGNTRVSDPRYEFEWYLFQITAESLRTNELSHNKGAKYVCSFPTQPAGQWGELRIPLKYRVKLG